MERVVCVAAFVLLVALLLPGVRALFRSRPRLFAAVKAVIFLVYIAGYLNETLLFRPVMRYRTAEWELLWSYRKALALPDGWRSFLNGTVVIADEHLLECILLNILLFVPMGYLLPFVFERIRPWQVLLIALLMSAATEVIQLVTKIGWFEFDDMLNNMLGCLIGLILARLLLGRSRRAA